MKKTLAALAIFSGAALSANAAMLKVSDQTFANFGLKLQIYGQALEDATGYTDANGNYQAKNAIDFTIQNARIYFSGQLNPIVQFGANLDFTVTGAYTSHEGTSTTKVRDAFINFRFMPELNVMAGYYRLPFSRETLTGRYDRIFMPQDGWVLGVYKDQILPTLYIPTRNNPPVYLTASNVLGGPSLGNALAITGGTDEADFARDAGVTVWGDVLGGMVKYYVGVYDGFGDHNAAEAVNGGGKDNLGYAFRIQFTPTMLGFQPEKGYLLSETYLGQKNTLSFGLGYGASKLDLGYLNLPTVYYYDKNQQQWIDVTQDARKKLSESYTFKSWTLDVNWEQKLSQFGLPLVPKVELGYVYTDGDNLPLSTTKNGQDQNGNPAVDAANVYLLDSVKTYYITLGTLFDQKIWLGKLGFYLKYQKTNVKVKNVVTNAETKVKPSVWTVAVPYYLAGQNAKIVLQYNKYDYDKKGFDPRNSKDDSNSDWTLAFQVQF